MAGSDFVRTDYFLLARPRLIFAISNRTSQMQKENQHLSESENEHFESNSENSAEYIKYIKKLELQRSVLNKIVNSDLNLINTANTINTIEPDNPESL